MSTLSACRFRRLHVVGKKTGDHSSLDQIQDGLRSNARRVLRLHYLNQHSRYRPTYPNSIRLDQDAAVRLGPYSLPH